MVQAANVIYLPPGVAAAPPQVAQTAIPFDRAFFEQILPGAVSAFCEQTGCEGPIVEVLTLDGTTHYVNGISGLTDSWVALHTADPEHDHAVQVFVPYQTIFRVEVHPSSDLHPGRMGFVTTPPKAPRKRRAAPPAPASKPAAPSRSAAKK
ncbi:MAG: hypothetical protein HUU14_10720 [Dehalococcoidia bacterium]|nr:MAG: hypothetical protein EDM76_08805 [bacterium]MCE7927735.1 hypothetical protein [Chloroflexi bacterium CFX7]MCK6564705.1 hypothetical protein [Dehalococcoidia bacterium]MCL4232406.1 hypothetical protein [Dehalococcoidia bacterium]NUQ56347.1 hypothetical protein [Dehalococcoidia bacterium]